MKLEDWLRADMQSAIAFHKQQERRMHDEGNRLMERTRAQFAETVLSRIEAWERGEQPIPLPEDVE